MIGLVGMLVQTMAPGVTIVPPVQPGVITVEALMRSPNVGAIGRAELTLLGETLLSDTHEYGHRQMVKLTVMSGDTVRCDVLPDCLRIRFGVSEADAASVIPLLTNILHDSELRDDDFKAAIDSLSFRRRDYWSSALEPEALRFREAHADETRALYREMGRPENLVISIAAAPNVASDLYKAWQSALATWDKTPQHLLPPNHAIPKPTFHRRGKLTTIVLRGAAIDPAAPDFATQLLAVFGLGGGKDSAVWKGLREGLGWSYRQEAILRNSSTGLEPVVEVVTVHSDADIDRSLLVRPALEKVVDKWTEADKLHAVAAAEALFSRGLGLDPLYFKGTKPASDDALFMNTYWRFKTGQNWQPQALVAAMRNVDVKTMQAAATKMLESSNVELIQGTG